MILMAIALIYIGETFDIIVASSVMISSHALMGTTVPNGTIFKIGERIILVSNKM